MLMQIIFAQKNQKNTMIPHSLFIKNFLSYGSKGEHVSFDPYHLICLSGKNGHGKSALLDALTWAIWGQARKTLQSVKPDQGLLRLGQSQMLVIAEFSCNGQRYRIRREYMNHHNKPYAQLDFGLVEEGKLISLTDKTIKATQESIINTIKLDYEGFCNTVFLRQGASNEFSKKSAKERKELLASILGLNTYEQVRKRALYKIKMAHIEYSHTISTIQRLTKDVNAYNELKTLYNQKKEALIVIKKKITCHNELFKEIELEKKLFYEAEQQLQQHINAYDDTTNNLLKTREELSKIYNTWKLFKQKQTTLPDMGLLLQKKTELLDIIDKQQQLHGQILTVKELLIVSKQKKQEYENKIKQACLTIEQQCLQETQFLEKEIQENVFLVRSIENTIVSQENELAQIIITLNTQEEDNLSYKKIQNIVAAKEKEIDRKKTFYQKMVAYGNMLSTKHKELLLKIEATHNIHNPSCPLCEQNLSLARKKFLRTKFEKMSIILSHQLKRMTRILPLLKNLIISNHETIESLKKEEAQYAVKQHNFDDLMKKKLLLEIYHSENLQSLKEITETIEAIKQKIQDRQMFFKQTMPSLDDNPEYQDIVKDIEKLNKKSSDCEYSQEIHTKALTDLDDIHKTLALYDNQQHSSEKQNQRANDIHNYIHKVRIIKKTQEKQFLQITEQKKIVATHSLIQNKIDCWQKEQDQLILEKENLITSTTSLHHQLEQCDKTLIEIQNLEYNAQQAQQTIEDYNAIALATGKDGIQALLIEEAIPSIEHEANKLLAKLTHNNARIFIDSLKDLKNGGTKETLDIKIADNAGIRPYELFSGGEAFRIDFALRIAVSTLLAQRAGTSLQTLIIDEGFGSQDEEGLQCITNTLHKIQDTFAKIIIVSHLPNMKDQFPVHFIIDKSSHGSTVSILEL